MLIVKNKKNLLIILLILIVIFTIGTVWLLRFKIAPKNDLQIDQTKMSQIQLFMTSGKNREAKKLLSDYLKQDLPLDIKYEAISAMAANYEALKDQKNALSWYLKAEALRPEGSPSVAVAIAQIAQAQGDKRMAIEYYKKAIERIQQDTDAFNDAYIPGYQRAIKALQTKSTSKNQTVAPEYQSLIKSAPTPKL